MAIDCGQGIGGVYIGLYLGKIPTSEGGRRKKNEKKLQRGRTVRAEGGGNGGGAAAAVLVVVMVRNKSKIIDAPLFGGGGGGGGDLFCTVGIFAPADWCQGEGSRRTGARARGAAAGRSGPVGQLAGGMLTGVYPPSVFYGWNDKGF